MKTGKIFLSAFAACLSNALFFCAANADNADYEKYRPKPNHEAIITSQTLNAADFGAIPDDGGNDYAAVMKAFRKLRELGKNVRLVFAPGTYIIEKPKTENSQSYFSLAGLDNCVIDGAGAKFVIKNPNHGFLVLTDSRNCLVENIEIDYDPLPWTEGLIRAVDLENNSIDVEVREGFPPPDADYFSYAGVMNWGAALDPEIPGRFKMRGQNHCYVTKIEKLEGRLFRLAQKTKLDGPSAPNFEVGDRYFLLARTSGGNLFSASRCADITFKNITSYASTSLHYSGLFSERLNYVGCRALIREGRWKGGNADFIHLQQNRVGPWIEGCHVEGISDDSLVFYSRPFYVAETAGARSVALSRAVYASGGRAQLNPLDIAVGDTLSFIDAARGAEIARAKVLSFNPETSSVELDADAELHPATHKGKPNIQVFNVSLTRGFVVKNNTLQNSRRYGLYWKGSDGVIENNRITGLSNCGITLHNDISAPNGPWCENVVIRNNTIIGCNRERGFFHSSILAPLMINAYGLDGVSSSANCHKNITITGNKIVGYIPRAISVMNTDGLVINGNETSPMRKGDELEPVLVKNCVNAPAAQ